MKKELSRSASRKILVSWFSSSSRAPMPSLSIRRHLRGWPWWFVSSNCVQHQRPFVQGLIVGPTPNPFYSLVSIITLLRRKDLPVLYIPATAITPIFSLIRDKNSFASSLTIYYSTISKAGLVSPNWRKGCLLTLRRVELDHVDWLLILDDVVHLLGQEATLRFLLRFLTNYEIKAVFWFHSVLLWVICLIISQARTLLLFHVFHVIIWWW